MNVLKTLVFYYISYFIAVYSFALLVWLGSSLLTTAQEYFMKKNRSNMTKSSKRQFRKAREKLAMAIAKHLGTTLTNKLKNTDAYTFSDPSMDLDMSQPDIRKISEVSLQFLPKMTGLRAFWEALDQTPIDQNLKEDLRDKLEAYIDQMKEVPAFEFLVEYHLGNVHAVDITKMIILLEKIALGLHMEEEDETETGTTDKD